MIRTYIEVIMNMMPIIASIICFGMYVYFYDCDGFSPAKAYTVLSLKFDVEFYENVSNEFNSVCKC
jgi:hypothetical protein